MLATECSCKFQERAELVYVNCITIFVACIASSRGRRKDFIKIYEIWLNINQILVNF